MSIIALQSAKTGMNAMQLKIDATSHDLSNAGTNGYKSVVTQFEDLLYLNFRQPGAQSSQQTQVPSGLSIGTGVRPVATVRNFTQGALQKTDNSFDMAINGTGFFQVQMPDGTTAYTRDGGFQLDNQGQIVTANGFVIQPATTVPQGTTSVTIGQDGTISAVVAGSNTPTQLGQFQLATFVNQTGLQSIGQNLYIETASSGTPTLSTPGLNGAGLINQGYVETSNVNVVEALVSLIQDQNNYQLIARVIDTEDNMLNKLSSL